MPDSVSIRSSCSSSSERAERAQGGGAARQRRREAEAAPPALRHLQELPEPGRQEGLPAQQAGVGGSRPARRLGACCAVHDGESAIGAAANRWKRRPSGCRQVRRCAQVVTERCGHMRSRGLPWICLRVQGMPDRVGSWAIVLGLSCLKSRYSQISTSPLVTSCLSLPSLAVQMRSASRLVTRVLPTTCRNEGAHLPLLTCFTLDPFLDPRRCPRLDFPSRATLTQPKSAFSGRSA